MHKLTLLILLGMILVSCQTTNITDFIYYGRLSDGDAVRVQKNVTLAFGRTAVPLDSLDRTGDSVDLPKGAVVKVLGLKHRIGRKKAIPEFYRENYTRTVDVWLVVLPDGRRAYMEVPEMAVGVYGRDSVAVTAVKDQPNSVLFLYKTTTSKEWTDNPGIKYDRWDNVAIYNPKYHYKPFVEISGLDKVENPALWQKILIKLAGPVDFFTKYTLSRFLYRDGSFYTYHPVIRTTTFWAVVIQAVLSFILLLVILVLTVPWLAARSVMYIPFIPNWTVILTARILAFIYFIIIATFLGVENGGFVGWLIMYFIGIRSDVKDEIEWNRCPYCRKTGLRYRDSTEGKWNTSSSSYDKKEEKYRTVDEYDRPNGPGKEHVVETTHHMGVKNYTSITRRRHHTNHLYCPHCREQVDLGWDEENTTTTSRWK